MKLLIVSWYFPPGNAMGALRVGKFAKYLVARGHEVRVLAGKDLPLAQNLPVEISGANVVYAPWHDVNFLPRAVQRLRRRFASGHAVSHSDAAQDEVRPSTSPLLRRMRDAYMAVTNFPDSQIGWYPTAVRRGAALLRTWRPDLVLASAPPYTSLLVGSALARRFAVPFAVEYRDRWLEDPYSRKGRIRLAIERRVEDACVRRARGFVTVSEVWAADYRSRFGRPVEVVYNGYDPDDFADDPPTGLADSHTLEIVYTGVLYPERRDPGPLFAAIAQLGEGKDRVRVSFYGADASLLLAAARRHGVERCVVAHDFVAYRQALDVQRRADVLLLLQWNNPLEVGNVPGKLFEYLAARRPVLGLGYEGGVPARILRERQAGIVVNDPQAIAAQLRAWLEAKRRPEGIPALPRSVHQGFARGEQFAIFERFLESMLVERG